MEKFLYNLLIAFLVAMGIIFPLQIIAESPGRIPLGLLVAGAFLGPSWLLIAIRRQTTRNKLQASCERLNRSGARLHLFMEGHPKKVGYLSLALVSASIVVALIAQNAGIAVFTVIAIVLFYGIVHFLKLFFSWREVNELFSKLENTYNNAKKGQLTTREAAAFADQADRCLAIISYLTAHGPEKARKDAIEVRDCIQRMIVYVAVRTPAEARVAKEISGLAELRRKGFITEGEFDAFSERFKMTSGEKARSIVESIEALHEQHEKGAIGKGNYNAAVWSLLDKLDRKI